ncbi:MAG: thiamine phosphate synthase [Huintestinicola sp.]
MKRVDLILYGITDSSYDRLSVEEQIEAAAMGGASIIQLREKHISEEDYVKKACRAVKAAHKCGIPLIVNDSIEAALKSGADGVHLGQSDGSAAEARKLLGSEAIIGVTAKTPEQAAAAERNGADYLGSGAMFVSPTKPDAVALSTAELANICKTVSIPVCAIGGITADNCAALKGTGISGIAVVSSLFGSQDKNIIVMSAKKLRKASEEICCERSWKS